MVLSQSERISQLLDNSRKYVSRNKVRDSSELTLIHQAKGSKTTVPSIVKATADPHSLQLMPPSEEQKDCAATVYYTGVGTNDQTALLYNKQKAAICADDDPAVNLYIILPIPKCSNIIPVVKRNYGGSLFFDIAYLSIPNSVDFQLDGSYPDFTIEWFQYALPGANESYPRIFSIGNSSAESISFNETYYINVDPTQSYVELNFVINNISLLYTGPYATDIFNKWIHIAVERYQGNTTLYINGVGNGSISTNYTVTDSTNPLIIGANWDTGNATAYYNGYLTNFRWTKGLAVYKQNFTVPKKPLTASPNTVLLFDASSTDTFIDDTSGMGHTVTFGTNDVVYNARTPFH